MKHKCLGLFISFLLFLSIISFVGLVQVKSLLNAKVFLQILDQAKIYEKITDIGKQINQTAGPDDSTLQKTIINAYSKSLDPDWTRKIVSENIPQFFDYLNNKTKTLNISIDLAHFKANLTNNYPDAAREEISALPACGQDQTFKENEIPDCLPAGTSADQANASITSGDFDELIAEVPNIYQITEQNQTIKHIKRDFDIINYGFWVLLVFCLLMVLLLIFLGRGDWPAIFRWSGTSLVVPSALLIVLDILYYFANSYFAKLLQSGAGENFASFSLPIIAVINQKLTSIGLFVSGAILLAGIVLIIVSYLLPKPAVISKPSK